jgi:drug/metabolite transporter (DMT)-like permease
MFVLHHRLPPIVLNKQPLISFAVMFVGMTFCLPIAYIVEYRNKRAALEAATRSAISADGLLAAAANDSENLSAPLLGGSDPNALPPSTSKSLLEEIKEVSLLAIPTFFDLIATILMNVGLLSVTASVYQMLRGAEMLFAALFAVVFLKRSLNTYHYRGIACCIAGITLVGTSSLMSGEGSASHAVDPAQILFGMALIVASQAVQAAQITFEDFFMADMAIPPLKIVGYEGLFGTLAMSLFLLPLVQRLPGVDGQGIHEDSYDTWHMIRNNPVISRILILDMIALLLYNVSGMCVTGHLGAVFRTVLETTRTLFVWLVDLMLFYTPLGMGKLGESWSKYSWVQAAGFVVLVIGTVVYGKGDDAEVAKEIAEGLYDEDVVETGGDTQNSTGTGTGGWSIPTRGAGAASPLAVGRGSSLKSSMNMNAFGSMPSSMSRSLRLR